VPSAAVLFPSVVVELVAAVPDASAGSEAVTYVYPPASVVVAVEAAGSYLFEVAILMWKVAFLF